MKDLRASTLIAGIALFVLIGGSATAASGLINGKQIKKGTVTAKQIRNKTITTSKLSPSTVKSLRGQAGSQGEPGAKGATGAAGATGQAGAPGVVSPVTASGSTVNLPNDVQTSVLELNLPAGSYMVNARATLTSQAASSNNRISCSIAVDDVNNSDFVDSVGQSPLEPNEEINLHLIAVTGPVSKLTLVCNSDSGVAQVRDSKMIAIPTEG